MKKKEQKKKIVSTIKKIRGVWSIISGFFSIIKEWIIRIILGIGSILTSIFGVIGWVIAASSLFIIVIVIIVTIIIILFSVNIPLFLAHTNNLYNIPSLWARNEIPIALEDTNEAKAEQKTNEEYWLYNINNIVWWKISLINDLYSNMDFYNNMAKENFFKSAMFFPDRELKRFSLDIVDGQTLLTDDSAKKLKDYSFYVDLENQKAEIDGSNLAFIEEKTYTEKYSNIFKKYENNLPSFSQQFRIMNDNNKKDINTDKDIIYLDVKLEITGYGLKVIERDDWKHELAIYFDTQPYDNNYFFNHINDFVSSKHNQTILKHFLEQDVFKNNTNISYSAIQATELQKRIDSTELWRKTGMDIDPFSSYHEIVNKEKQYYEDNDIEYDSLESEKIITYDRLLWLLIERISHHSPYIPKNTKNPEDYPEKITERQFNLEDVNYWIDKSKLSSFDSLDNLAKSIVEHKEGGVNNFASTKYEKMSEYLYIYTAISSRKWYVVGPKSIENQEKWFGMYNPYIDVNREEKDKLTFNVNPQVLLYSYNVATLGYRNQAQMQKLQQELLEQQSGYTGSWDNNQDDWDDGQSSWDINQECTGQDCLEQAPNIPLEHLEDWFGYLDYNEWDRYYSKLQENYKDVSDIEKDYYTKKISGSSPKNNIDWNTYDINNKSSSELLNDLNFLSDLEFKKNDKDNGVDNLLKAFPETNIDDYVWFLYTKYYGDKVYKDFYKNNQILYYQEEANPNTAYLPNPQGKGLFSLENKNFWYLGDTNFLAYFNSDKKKFRNPTNYIALPYLYKELTKEQDISKDESELKDEFYKYKKAVMWWSLLSRAYVDQKNELDTNWDSFIKTFGKGIELNNKDGWKETDSLNWALSEMLNNSLGKKVLIEYYNYKINPSQWMTNNTKGTNLSFAIRQEYSLSLLQKIKSLANTIIGQDFEDDWLEIVNTLQYEFGTIEVETDFAQITDPKTAFERKPIEYLLYYENKEQLDLADFFSQLQEFQNESQREKNAQTNNLFYTTDWQFKHVVLGVLENIKESIKHEADYSVFGRAKSKDFCDYLSDKKGLTNENKNQCDKFLHQADVSITENKTEYYFKFYKEWILPLEVEYQVGDFHNPFKTKSATRLYWECTSRIHYNYPTFQNISSHAKTYCSTASKYFDSNQIKHSEDDWAAGDVFMRNLEPYGHVGIINYFVCQDNSKELRAGDCWKVKTVSIDHANKEVKQNIWLDDMQNWSTFRHLTTCSIEPGSPRWVFGDPIEWLDNNSPKTHRVYERWIYKETIGR